MIALGLELAAGAAGEADDDRASERAVCAASTTLLELPEVDRSHTTSPAATRPSTCLLKM